MAVATKKKAAKPAKKKKATKKVKAKQKYLSDGNGDTMEPKIPSCLVEITERYVDAKREHANMKNIMDTCKEQAIEAFSEAVSKGDLSPLPITIEVAEEYWQLEPLSKENMKFRRVKKPDVDD